MKVEFEFDQILFKKIIGIYKNWKTKNSQEEISRTILLEDISPRLTLIARALTGKNIDIMPAEKEGGWKNDIFYLPASFSILPTIEANLNFYIFRVVYLSVQSEEKLNWVENNRIKSVEESRIKAKEIAPSILEKIEQEYLPVFRFYNSIKKYFTKSAVSTSSANSTDPAYPYFWLYGKYMTSRGRH